MDASTYSQHLYLWINGYADNGLFADWKFAVWYLQQMNEWILELLTDRVVLDYGVLRYAHEKTKQNKNKNKTNRASVIGLVM